MKDKIIEIFREALDMEEDQELKMDDKFRDYDDWDSIGYLSVISLLDDEFDIVIENEDFKKLETLQEVLDEVKKRVTA